MRRVLRLLLALLSAAATAGLGLASLDLWAAPSAVQAWLVLTVAVLAVAGTWVRLFVEERAERRRGRSEKAAYVVRSTVLAVASECAIDVRDLGLSLWVPGRRRFVVTGARRLRRVHRERLAFRPPPSAVRWTSDKGVIGECLREGVPVEQDVADVRRRYQHVPAERWEREVPAEARKGLTRKEFDQAARYDLVRAVPVTVDGEPAPIGCLSLDVLGAKASRAAADGKADALLEEAALSLTRLGIT